MSKMKDSIGKSFSWAYIDRLTTQGLSFVISIILARLIDPTHYGIVVMAMVFVNILDTFVNPGMNSALVQKKDPDETDYSTMFWLNCILSLFLYGLVFLATPMIEAFYEMDRLALVIRIMALRLPFGAMQSIQLAFVQKKLIYRKYFFVSLFGTVLAGLCAIYMAYTGMGVWALVANSIVNCAFDTILAFVFIPWRPTRKISVIRFRAMFSFGYRILAAKLIDVVYSNISAFFIGKKYVSSDLSFYNKGRLFPQQIVESISASISDVLFPVLSSIQDKKEQLKQTERETIKISTYVLFPILVGLFVCSENMIRLLLTDAWLSCVPFLRIMCAYYLCVPASGIILQGIKALGYSTVLLKIEIIKKIYSVIIIILSIFLFDSPIAIACGVMISGFISLALNIFISNKYIGYSIAEHIADIFPAAVISMIMGALTYLIGLVNMHYSYILIAQIIIGIGIYLLLSHITKNEQFLFLLSKIKHIKNQKEHDDV